MVKGKKDEKGKKEGQKRKRRPSVRLPVAPPSWAHRPKPEYRRQREKEHVRREFLEEESPDVGADGDEASTEEDSNAS